MNWADDSMKLLPESQSHSQMVGHLKWNIKNEREKCYWECGVLSSDCDFCQPSFACCVHDIKQIYYTHKKCQSKYCTMNKSKADGTERKHSTNQTEQKRNKNATRNYRIRRRHCVEMCGFGCSRRVCLCVLIWTNEEQHAFVLCSFVRNWQIHKLTQKSMGKTIIAFLTN